MSKVVVNLTVLFRYIGSRLGYKSSHGVSPYELAVQCLKMDGIEVPPYVSPKKTVKAHWEHILESAPANYKRSKLERKEKRVAVESARKDFYLSREWRALRYRVLNAYEGRCQCCGATAHDGVRIHVDHIKPRSRFPELELVFENLQVLCEDCNLGKSNDYENDWRPADLHLENVAKLRVIK